MIRLALSLLFIVVTFPVNAEENSGTILRMQIERVIDGDTFVASGRKIRLWGIDAPEKGSDLYKVSTMYMETILEEKNLSCRFIEKDRYQRDVMQCFIDRQDIGSMMVQMGMASDFEKYSNGYYEAEEDYAKSKRIGIWKNMQPNSDKPI